MENRNINNETEYKQGWSKDLLVGFLAGIFSVVFVNMLSMGFGLEIIHFQYLVCDNIHLFFKELFSIKTLLEIGYLLVLTIPSMLGMAVGRHFFLKKRKNAILIFLLPQIYPLLALTITFLIQGAGYITGYIIFQMPFLLFASLIVYFLCQDIPKRSKLIRIVFSVIVLFLILASYMLHITSDYRESRKNLEKAMETKNADFCKGDFSCIANVAVDTKNLDLCYDIKEGDGRFQCIAEVAKANKDAKLCENISKDNSRYSYCYIDIAIDTKNPDLCEKAEYQSHREQCYREIGLNEEKIEGSMRDAREREKMVNQKINEIKKEIFPLFDSRINFDSNYFATFYVYDIDNAKGGIQANTENKEYVSEFEQALKEVSGIKEVKTLGIQKVRYGDSFNFTLIFILDEEKF